MRESIFDLGCKCSYNLEKVTQKITGGVNEMGPPAWSRQVNAAELCQRDMRKEPREH